MFGTDKTDELQLDQLAALLNSSFDKKISGFSAKAESLTRDLLKAKNQFGDACKKFESLDVEPERENIYIDNTSVLKEQKNSYSRAVIRIASEWEIEIGSAPNLYYKYDTVLFGTENFRNEVLHANGNFKKVLYSYSNYLDDFKKSFSHMEKTKDSLKREIDKVEDEFLEFKTINEQISELRSLCERHSEIERALSSSKQDHVQGQSAFNEKEFTDNISAAEGELSKLESEISEISGRMQRLCLPLERAARKLDHSTQGKRQLYPYLSDPSNMIRSEADYKEFKTLLSNLDKSLESVPTTDKDSLKTKDNVSKLMAFDLYGELTRISSLKGKKSEVASRLQMLKIQLKTQKDYSNASKRLLEDKESLKKEAEGIKSKMDGLKRSIQELFLEYYKKRVIVAI